jgi:SAM-dependent methyltransferase
MGHRVTVIDPERNAVQELDRQQANIAVIRGDFLSTPLDTGSFDVAVAVESLQYMVRGDFATIFERVRALLRPRGIFLFTELNSRSWRYLLHRLRRDRMTYKVAGTSHYRAALKAAGFAIREVSGFVWMPFGVTSNSPLVPAFAWLERAVALRYWTAQSPWLLFAAQAPP